MTLHIKSDSAYSNEKFVVSKRIQTRIFGYRDNDFCVVLQRQFYYEYFSCISENDSYIGVCFPKTGLISTLSCLGLELYCLNGTTLRTHAGCSLALLYHDWSVIAHHCLTLYLIGLLEQEVMNFRSFQKILRN